MQKTSSIAAFVFLLEYWQLAAALIIILWILASQDRGYGKKKKCRGCMRYIHTNIPDSGLPKNWTRTNRNPYPLLITFACILFLAWTAVGGIGYTAKDIQGYRLVPLFLIIVRYDFYWHLRLILHHLRNTCCSNRTDKLHNM